MKTRIKFLIFGIIIGSAFAFPLGINFGRDDPLLSNPLNNPSMQDRARDKAMDLADEARDRVHKATEPVREKLKQ